MKAKEIQELLDFIAKSGLAEVQIETDQFKINVKKHTEALGRFVESIPTIVTPQPVAPSPLSPTPSAVQAAEAPKENPADSSTEKNYLTIKSPMIGTFYRTPNPDSPNFVSVGDEVKPGKAVCIIEAMKLFNEIESEISGRIVKVLVENASPVEYDQPLFLVEPL